jgi:hypothetical protein
MDRRLSKIHEGKEMPFRFEGRCVRFCCGVWEVWCDATQNWITATGAILAMLIAVQPVPACFVEPIHEAFHELHTHAEQHVQSPAMTGNVIQNLSTTSTTTTAIPSVIGLQQPR